MSKVYSRTCSLGYFFFFFFFFIVRGSLIICLFACVRMDVCVLHAPHNVGYRESKQSQPLEAIPVVLHCLQTGNCTAQDSESFRLKHVYQDYKSPFPFTTNQTLLTIHTQSYLFFGTILDTLYM